jgi:hypothetical protein
MFNLLKKLYINAEGLNRQQLIRLIAFIVLVFIPVGFFVGYVISGSLINSETDNLTPKPLPTVEEKYFEGKITYIDPHYYPDDKVTYELVDQSGKEVILLSSTDQKLVVSEGHFAKVYGVVRKTLDGKKDVLYVSQIVINNGTN